MIRPNLPQNFNFKKDIIFQIIDWKDYDIFSEEENENENEEETNEDESDYKEKNKFKKQRKLIIRGYGVTDNGNSICIHIDGFQPYFYFKIPQSWDQKYFIKFKNQVLKLAGENQKEGIVEYKIIKKKEFYGFTNNELFNFGLFVFKNQSAYYTFKKIMKEKKIMDIDFSNKLYETKVSSLLRFFHVKNIDPSGWMKIEAGKYSRNLPSMSRVQIDISVSFNDIIKLDLNNIAKMLIASFDIECCSDYSNRDNSLCVWPN